MNEDIRKYNHRFVCISTTTFEDKIRLQLTKDHFFSNEKFPQDRFETYISERNSSNPIIGCAKAHATVAKESLNKFKETQIITTVLESDARVMNDEHVRVSDWVEKIIPFAQSHGKIDLLLGSVSQATLEFNTAIKVPNTTYTLVQAKQGSGFYFYAPLTEKGYSTIANYNKSSHIDNSLIRDIVMKVFVVVPFIGNTVNGFSIIRNRDAHFEQRVKTIEKSFITRLSGSQNNTNKIVKPK